MTFLRIFGKFLISVGLGVLLFVGWTLWGTGLYTEREQGRLEKEFNAALRTSHTIGTRGGGGSRGSDGAGSSGSGGGSTKPSSGLPPAGYLPRRGEPVFRMDIPALDLSKIVVEGVGTEELRIAPGHYPSCRRDFGPPLCTPFPEVLPGEPGRVIVSGHRTTYGAPFWAINELRSGDEIKVATRWGKFTYEVTKSAVVAPTSPFVVRQGDKAELVLTTCDPRFSAANRLIVYAAMKPVA